MYTRIVQQLAETKLFMLGNIICSGADNENKQIIYETDKHNFKNFNEICCDFYQLPILEQFAITFVMLFELVTNNKTITSRMRF